MSLSDKEKLTVIKALFTCDNSDSALDEREDSLDEREDALDEREDDLNRREAALTKRTIGELANVKDNASLVQYINDKVLFRGNLREAKLHASYILNNIIKR